MIVFTLWSGSKWKTPATKTPLKYAAYISGAYSTRFDYSHFFFLAYSEKCAKKTIFFFFKDEVINWRWGVQQLQVDLPFDRFNRVLLPVEFG